MQTSIFECLSILPYHPCVPSVNIGLRFVQWYFLSMSIFPSNFVFYFNSQPAYDNAIQKCYASAQLLHNTRVETLNEKKLLEKREMLQLLLSMMDFSSSVQITKTTKHENNKKKKKLLFDAFVRNPKCWTLLICFFFHLSISDCELNHSYLSIVFSTINCTHKHRHSRYPTTY